jgi:hypothetical protein
MAESITGPVPAELANTVSQAIHVASVKGLDLHQAIAVVIRVAWDYGVRDYGRGPMRKLLRAAVGP